MKRRKKMLTQRAANGLKISYVGSLELEIDVHVVKAPNCRVLVLKDTPATSQQKKDYLVSLELMFWHISLSLVPCSNKGLIVSPGRQKPIPLVFVCVGWLPHYDSPKLSGKCSCYWSSLWSNLSMCQYQVTCRLPIPWSMPQRRVSTSK